MATSYTDGIAIELIGSGDQAGTWGDTTNDNLKRIEQGIAQYAEVDLEDPSPTSWTLLDTVAAYASGSEGRAAYVKFTGSLSGTHTVNIRGDDGSTQARRVFFAHNATDQTLTFTAGSGASVNLSSGFIALIYTTSADGDSAVGNGLANLSVDKVELANGETIENGTNNQIDLKSTTTTVGGGSAGTLSTSGANDLTLNTNTGTTTGSIVIADGASGDITVTTNADGKIKLLTGSTTGGVLLIDDGYLNFGGSTTGTGGYGIRDSSGTIQVKNEGGSWGGLGWTQYESSETGFDLNQRKDLSHGLGVYPKFVSVVLKVNKSGGIYGYADDDELYVGVNGAYSQTGGLGYSVNSSAVSVMIPATGFYILKYDIPGEGVDYVSISSTNDQTEYFNIVVRAWA